MQTVVILGAGGAARAIAYEALQRHAHVIILNRTQKKAVDLAEELGCTGGDFARLRDLSYTVLINALPLSAYADQSCYAWLNLGVLSVHVLAMDIVYNPIQTPFLQLAEQAGCTCIFGYEMYINQAIMQIMRWFDPSTQELQKIKQKMLDYFLDKIKSAVRVDLGL